MAFVSSKNGLKFGGTTYNAGDTVPAENTKTFRALRAAGKIRPSGTSLKQGYRSGGRFYGDDVTDRETK